MLFHLERTRLIKLVPMLVLLSSTSLQPSGAAPSSRPRPAAESGLMQQITAVIYRMAGGALPLDIGFLVAAFYLLCSDCFNDGKLSSKDDLRRAGRIELDLISPRTNPGPGQRSAAPTQLPAAPPESLWTNHRSHDQAF